MNTTTILPILWTEDIISAQSLTSCFRMGLPGLEGEGHHIIAMQSEVMIRLLAEKIRRADGRVDIFPCESPLAVSIASMGQNAFPMILFGLVPYQQWVESLSDAPLDLKDAVLLAEDCIRHEPESVERSVFLDQLRERARISDYTWNNKYLKQIQGKTDRTPAKDPDEQLRLELLALIKEADPVKQVRKRAEIASYYRISKGEIQYLTAVLDTNSKTPKAQFFRLDDFLSMASDGIDYLIPGLLPRGETVLCAGLPKSGKTLLAIDAGFAIATGECQFLGEEVQQGRVLLVSVDESAQSTRAKLLKRGFRSRDAENLAVMTSWDISQLDQLEQKLEDFRPDLVIIDSLKRITAGREISENSAEFADVIYTLKELIGKYSASGILIHHSNKNQEATGVSRVRGSTAITGACWGIWQLDIPPTVTEGDNKPAKGETKKFDPTNPNRIFTAICRDTEGVLLNIQRNPENNGYLISDQDANARAEHQTQEDLVLALLSVHSPNGLTGREIMEALGVGRGIYTVLDRMVSRRTVTQRQSKTDRRSMVYATPNTNCHKGDTLPPPLPETLLTNFDENNTEYGLDNSQQIVNNPGKISQQDLVTDDDTVDYFDDAVASVSGDSQQDETPKGGVGVVCDSLHLREVPPTVTLPTKPKAKVGDRVFVDNCPHADKFGPYLVEEIQGDFAKVELFSKLQLLDKLTVVEVGNG